MQLEKDNLSRYLSEVMGKKSKKNHQENQSNTVGEVSDNVSRATSENIQTTGSGNISPLFDELPDHQ